MKKVLKKNIVNTELYHYCSISVLFNYVKDMLRYKFNGERLPDGFPRAGTMTDVSISSMKGKGCIPMSLCRAISQRRDFPPNL